MATHTQSVLINWFGVLFVILNTFGLGLRLEVGKILGQAFALASDLPSHKQNTAR